MNTIKDCTFTTDITWDVGALDSLHTVVLALHTNARALDKMVDLFKAANVTVLSIDGTKESTFSTD